MAFRTSRRASPNLLSKHRSTGPGSIGLGYFIDGKKHQSISAMVGGILMMVASYFSGSPLLMSLIRLGIVAAVCFLIKMGN